MSSNINESFSHRPEAGVSVGVRIDGGNAIVAATYRRFNEQFNRKYALTVLRGRLANPRPARNGVTFTGIFPVPEGITAKQFMRTFRESFRSGGPEGGEENANDRLATTRSRSNQSNIIFRELAPYVANEMYTQAAGSTETIGPCW